MRAIDGDALEKHLSDAEIEAIKQRRYVFASALNTICGNVRNFPTIEPEREKGKWIKMSDADGEYYCCDQCGEELPRYMTETPSWDRPYPHKQSIGKTDFCPNCGSDMRGDQDENN